MPHIDLNYLMEEEFMKHVLIGTALGLSSLSALAADTNFGAELLLGTTDQTVKTDGGDVKGDDTSFGIRGSYTFNENLAFELSFNDYGESKDRYIDEFGDTINDSIATSSVNFGLKGILPLDNGFSLHARLGLALWDAELEETDSAFPGETFSGDDSGNDFYYGVGAQLQVKENLSIGAEYTISEFDISPDSDFAGLDADLEVKTFALSVGISF